MYVANICYIQDILDTIYIYHIYIYTIYILYLEIYLVYCMCVVLSFGGHCYWEGVLKHQ